MEQLDTRIDNAIVITADEADTVHRNGWVGIADGRIAGVGSMADPLPTAVETEDAGGGIVMPGLVNTHTHLPMTLFRGLADDLPLETWLTDRIFEAERRYIDPETVAVGTRLACAEMIRSGTTTCCDGYFHEDAVAEAVLASGMRAVLGQGVIDFPAPGVPDPADGVRTAAAFLDRWTGVSDRITPSIFCHSPYTCGDATLKAAKAAAGLHPFQIHVAETRSERDQSIKQWGVSPVVRLDRLGVIDERTLLVHGVWIDKADREIIARRGAAVAHCPESNMKLASGIAPVPALMAAGIPVGLGTDGCASANTLDLFGTADRAAKLQKVVTGDPTALSAVTVVAMLTRIGARAVGLGETVGALIPGRAADLIRISVDRPHLVPLYEPRSHLVYAVRGDDVTDVMVAGRWLLRRGVLTTLDEAGVKEAARAVGRRISADREGGKWR